jgi:cytochrome P450
MNLPNHATSTASHQQSLEDAKLFPLIKKLELLEIYGPNIVTTEGKTFRFHLRIVAPPFADGSGANDLVWNESKFQTSRLMSSWHKQSPSSIQRDIDSLSLAVIAKAAFGQQLDWTAHSTETKKAVPAGHTLTFTEAMNETTHHMITVLLLPRWLMYITPFRNAAIAHSEFERYVREMIRAEKRNIRQSKGYESASARGNLLTSVLRASESEATATPKPGDAKKQAFSEDEVMGNLFLYLLAGYETTSNAMVYGLIALALYPEIQDNVIAEVDRIYEGAASDGRNELTYTDDFGKFDYTYGFMVFTHSFINCVLIAPSR